MFGAIHSAILSGELPAGARLRIRDLADELGTSVMPVREAIRRLEEIGLAEAQPYRGAVVKGFTHEELLKLYAVRRLLETEGTSLGAAAVGERDLATMRQLLGAMSEAVAAGDAVSYLARDEDFLDVLYSAGGNPVLVELIRTLWHRCRSYKILGAEQALSGDAGSRDLLTHQERLLEALSSGDGQAAVRITTESLDAAIERIRTSIDAH